MNRHLQQAYIAEVSLRTFLFKEIVKTGLRYFLLTLILPAFASCVPFKNIISLFLQGFLCQKDRSSRCPMKGHEEEKLVHVWGFFPSNSRGSCLWPQSQVSAGLSMVVILQRQTLTQFTLFTEHVTGLSWLIHSINYYLTVIVHLKLLFLCFFFLTETIEHHSVHNIKLRHFHKVDC